MLRRYGIATSGVELFLICMFSVKGIENDSLDLLTCKRMSQS